jgi:hypothetical protein
MDTKDIINAIRQRHKLDESKKVLVLSPKVALKAMPHNQHAFTARITTDSLDRQDEVVLPAGGNLNDFYASGCIAWNHDYDHPVGFPNRDKGLTQTDNYIECGGTFMKRPDDYQGEFFPDFARAFVQQAVEAGINPGVSIGFMPIESRIPTKADKSRWGSGIQMVHSKWKLLEFSIAPVQANQDAVVTAIGKGLITKSVAKAVGYDVEKIPDPPERLTKAFAQHGTLLLANKSPAKVIRETLIISIQSENKSSFADELRKGVEREILRKFGKVYA